MKGCTIFNNDTLILLKIKGCDIWRIKDNINYQLSLLRLALQTQHVEISFRVIL